MSTDTLAPDDLASLTLGRALRRAMMNQKGPAERCAAAWATYTALCEHELTTDEAIEMRTVTGLIDMSDRWEV